MKSRRIHTRRSIRLPYYDYTESGAYFITICAYQHYHIFGHVEDDKVFLNHVGLIAKSVWEQIPSHFPFVTLDHFVIMPNHMHGIVLISKDDEIASDSEHVGARHALPLHSHTSHSDNLRLFGNPPAKALSSIVGSYKSAVSKEANSQLRKKESTLWQRNYYEHVIRDEADLNRIREYVLTNPSKWIEDKYYSD